MYHFNKFILILLVICGIFSFTTVTSFAQTCPDDAPALNPSTLDEPWAIDWWVPRHEDKLIEEGRENTKLLFLGDSIIHGWENSGEPIWNQYFREIGSHNLGFGGDRTENVLWRLKNGALEGISPELTVLMIGTNNTGHRKDKPECTARGIELIIDELFKQLPDSQVLLLAIFPRGQEPTHELRQLNDEINERIKKFGSRSGVHFHDINQIFLTDDGLLTEEIMPDMLHPNEEGYRLWAEKIYPLIHDILNP